ncbi:MAG: ferritin family protein [Candidatus Thermoplasmatota archaeon]
MYERLKELGLKEILGYAIDSEEKAHNFYLDLAKNANVNELVAHRFESIGREELIHKTILLGLHKRLFGDAHYLVPEGLPPLESSVEITTLHSLIETLELAMQNEYNAYKIYTYLFKHHHEHRKLFHSLARREQGHYDALRFEKDLFEEEIMEDPHLRHREILALTRDSTAFRPLDA